MSEEEIIKIIFNRISELSLVPSNLSSDYSRIIRIEKLIQTIHLLADFLIEEYEIELEKEFAYQKMLADQNSTSVAEYADIFGYSIQEAANDLMKDPNDITEDDIDDLVGR